MATFSEQCKNASRMAHHALQSEPAVMADAAERLARSAARLAFDDPDVIDPGIINNIAYAATWDERRWDA